MSEKNEWKLVPVVPTDEMVKAAFDQFEISAPGFATGNDARQAIYAAMLNAAPSAPGDAQDERQAFEAWFARRGVWPALCFEEVFIAGWKAHPADAPATGDALDAQRYRKLRRKVCIAGGQFHILNLAPTYVAPDAAVELDSVLDAALAAQVPQQGEA